MNRDICCACERPIEGEVVEMGNRSYCVECHTRVLRDRGALWKTNLTQVVALLVFVAIVALIGGSIQPHLEGVGLILVGIVLTLVPAVLWLAFFYAQDAREPEPKGLVLAVFILGGLLARAVGIPLIEEVFRTSQWLATGTACHILGSILVIGFIEQFLVYAAVRYSIYNVPEFDERVDGIVYGTAAALGYATMVNAQYVVQSGGVDLVFGSIRIAITAMAMASFGGLIGYFLGRCKFEDEPLWWMTVGLILAAFLDGLFTYLRGEITTTSVGLSGGGYNPWPGLILATVVAVVTFTVLFLLIRRLQRRFLEA